MNVPTSIRLAERADVPTLVSLMTTFYEESGYPLDAGRAAAAFQELLADEACGRIWVAEIGGEAVGYVVLTLGFSMEYGGRDGFVDDLFIGREHRGEGLGRALLEALQDACGELGVRALHLEVERSNSAALELYKSQGFRANDRRLLTLRLGDALHESPDRETVS